MDEERKDQIDNENIPAVEDSRDTKVGKKTGLFLEKLELEIKNGFRIFNYKDKIFHIKMSNVKTDTLINNYKAKVASRLLKEEDIMMKGEILASLRKRGLWDDQKEKKEKEFRERISKCIADIMVEKSKDEPNSEFILEKIKEKTVVELDLALLTRDKDSFMDSTLENKIDEEVIKYKLSLLITDEEDNRLWNSVDEFENYSDKLFINTITTEAIYFWAGLDQSMFDLAPGA